MLDSDIQKKKAQELSLKHAKTILSEMGVKNDDRQHTIMQYELQFEIYHAIKKTLKIN